MAEMIHTVDTKQITLTLKMPRFFGLRMWLAIKVLQFAGMIAPVTIEIEVKDDL